MKNTLNKNKFLLLAILATAIALGVHAYLTQHFYQLKFGAGGAESACNINEVFNCDAVTASKYSALFGIPMALWGLATNLILLYFLLVTKFNLVQDPARTSRYALALSGFTVLASVVMGLISLNLAHICLFCVGAYVLSLVGFIGTWLGSEDVSIANIKEDFRQILFEEKWVGGFLLAIPALSFMGNIMYLESHGYTGVQKMAQEKVAYWQVSPVQNFDTSTGLSLQKGTGEPVMTIVEFADFRCPHCKFAAAPLHAFAKSHPDVRLIFKPFPLDSTCNEAIPRGGDGISCGLSAAVMCAETLAQKGWEAHDFYFEIQEEIIRSSGGLEKNLQRLAEKTGLKFEDIKACVEDPKTMESIRTMAKEGATAQIQGTPTVFVNGKLLSSGQVIPVLNAAYQTLKK